VEEPVISDSARQSLQHAIDLLYRTFTHYRLQPHMDACPCCVHDDDDKRFLYRAELHELSADDLCTYAFKAMTTWGDGNDFRHFLPRLFELQASATPIPIDNEILFGKLRYARWRTWPSVEQQAVQTFLLTWGRFLLESYPSSPDM
jgi:hypothetical protein